MDALPGAHMYVYVSAYRIVNELVAAARSAGCYKVILDCGEGNVDFYAKSGFQRREVHMVPSQPNCHLRHGGVRCPGRSTSLSETVCESTGAIFLR